MNGNYTWMSIKLIHITVVYEVFLTWDTKYILWMDDQVLSLTYESLAIGSLNYHIFDTTWSPQRLLCNQDEIIRPWYLRRLTQGMRCDEILGQGSGISDKEFPMLSYTHLVLTWVTN